MCGLKRLLVEDEDGHKESHPAWVCGLKPKKEGKISPYMESHPAWVCGLKLDYKVQVKFAGICHTLRGCVD